MVLKILGTSSSQPTLDRNPSCQVLNVNNDLFMIDAGEGAQLNLTKFKIKRNQIEVIFISHMHGDHIFGLPGIITSFMHFSRTNPLTIIGPRGLKLFIETFLQVSLSSINFEMIIQEIDANVSTVVWQTKHVTVTNFPLDHRIPTCGYHFKEREKPRNIIPEKITEYTLSNEEIRLLKIGESVYKESKLLKSDDVCLPPIPLKSYAYISDTAYNPSILSVIQDCDLIYHEATYLEDMQQLALDRKHSTTADAAKIAIASNAKKLIIGHYSSRYKDVNLFEKECQKYFKNSFATSDGDEFII
jgi:ribonuclease Z